MQLPSMLQGESLNRPISQEAVITSPYIILTHPICESCGRTMRLVCIERHPQWLRTEVCSYDCECGASERKPVDHRNGVEHFGQTGSIADLYRHYGIDADSIMAAAQAVTAGRPIRHLRAL